MFCIDCGVTLIGNQKKFCSRKCSKHWYKNNDVMHPVYEGKAIRQFNCAQCNYNVYVYAESDLRTKFCSNMCSRKYFRHRYGKGNKGTSSMSRPMTFDSFVSRERWFDVM